MTLLAREVVLKCYYVPETLRQYADCETPLPKGVERVLQEVVQKWQPQHSIDDAPEYELHRALLYFVKHVVFLEHGDHYRTLMAAADAPQNHIEQHYRWLVTLLQSDSQDSVLNISRYMVRISRAVAIVGDPGQRRVYNRTLFGPLAAEGIDINVDDIAEGVLGISQSGVRVRQTVEAEYTVEFPGDAVAPAAQSPNAMQDPSPNKGQQTRLRNDVTRSRTGIVVTALSVPAAMFWTSVSDQEPAPTSPQAINGFLHDEQHASAPSASAVSPEGNSAAGVLRVNGIANMHTSQNSASTEDEVDSFDAGRDPARNLAQEGEPALVVDLAPHAATSVATAEARNPSQSLRPAAALESSGLPP